MSVCLSAWNNSVPTGRIYTKFGICTFFDHLSRKFEINLSRARIRGTLQEDQLTFLVVSRSALLRMRNVSDRPCKETQNTHCMINNFFLAQILPFCDMMWRKTPVEPDSPQMTIWRMRILRYVPKPTNTHLQEYRVPLAFPQQQWLQDAPHCYAIPTAPCDLQFLKFFFDGAVTCYIASVLDG